MTARRAARAFGDSALSFARNPKGSERVSKLLEFVMRQSVQFASPHLGPLQRLAMPALDDRHRLFQVGALGGQITPGRQGQALVHGGHAFAAQAGGRAGAGGLGGGGGALSLYSAVAPA